MGSRAVRPAVGCIAGAMLLVACADPMIPCEGFCPRFMPISVTVLDAVDGGPVDGGLVNGSPCPGPSCEVRWPDGGVLSGAGTYPVEVTAPGFQPVDLVVTVPSANADGCCKLSFTPQHRDVPLHPL